MFYAGADDAAHDSQLFVKHCPSVTESVAYRNHTLIFYLPYDVSLVDKEVIDGIDLSFVIPDSN